MFLLLLSLTGCDRILYSEEGTLSFFAADVKADALAAGFGTSTPVLAGSRICGELRGADDEALGEKRTACYAEAVSGPLELDGDGCLLITGAGDLVWSFSSLDCSADSLGYPPVDDRFAFSSIDASELVATWDFWAERAVADGELVVDGAAPDGWLPAVGEPLLILADTAVRLPISLFTDSGGQAAWVPGEAELTGDGGSVALDRGWVAMQLEAGDRSTLSLELHGVASDLGEVEAVAPSEVASLEVVPAWYPDGDYRSPAGARALLRTSDGRPVFGAPVQWELLDGELAVMPVTDDVGPDYTQLGDQCRKPSKRAGLTEATVRASWGSLADEAVVSWLQPDGPASEEDEAELAEEDANWIRPDSCPPGCGCAAGGSGSAGLAALFLGLLGLLRRRSSTPATGFSAGPAPA